MSSHVFYYNEYDLPCNPPDESWNKTENPTKELSNAILPILKNARKKFNDYTTDTFINMWYNDGYDILTGVKFTDKFQKVSVKLIADQINSRYHYENNARYWKFIDNFPFYEYHLLTLPLYNYDSLVMVKHYNNCVECAENYLYNETTSFRITSKLPCGMSLEKYFSKPEQKHLIYKFQILDE